MPGWEGAEVSQGGTCGPFGALRGVPVVLVYPWWGASRARARGLQSVVCWGTWLRSLSPEWELGPLLGLRPPDCIRSVLLRGRGS